jgi:membrane-associated protease RseP (regulator of RpoE activity)
VILLAHEFGHWFACRYWGVEATLPFFMPSPGLFGTLGAFIGIRSPVYTRKSLFDIGVSGPMAGFLTLLPFLGAGLAMSRIGGTPSDFGSPLLVRLWEWVLFPGVQTRQIHLHPMAAAALTGLLATSVNLLPMGQLDGGHIVYALFGHKFHRIVSNVFVFLLALAGFLFPAWWLWAALGFFFLRRHPLICDETAISGIRMTLGAGALAVFALSLCVVPLYLS